MEISFLGFMGWFCFYITIGSLVALYVNYSENDGYLVFNSHSEDKFIVTCITILWPGVVLVIIVSKIIVYIVNRIRTKWYDFVEFREGKVLVDNGRLPWEENS